MYLVPNKISGNSIPHFAKRDNEKPRLSGDIRGKGSSYGFFKAHFLMLLGNASSGQVLILLLVAGMKT